MGMRHAERVQAAIDRNLQKHPELGTLFDSTRDERFFVKNLERVQGDERDTIILSIGYGKDRSGKLPYRFGPLNQDGGERRLNVAITRARCRMVLVSSFSHLDMDPNRSNKLGVQLLRSYIEFASSKGEILGNNGHSMESQNPFEADVFDAITSRGVPMLSQYGVSGYRIDFVAQHPQQPGRFVLAIETDGRTYHSSKTARDRDRLRQQHLEALGWRFHRIWSTDWFMEREKEIERALVAYRKAVAEADEVTQKTAQITEGEENNRCSSYENLSESLQQTDIPTMISGDQEDSLKTIDSSFDFFDNNDFDCLTRSNERQQTHMASRPDIISGKNIKEYSENELDSVIMWIKEDGKLRTDEELLEEIMKELGFRKKGKLIRNALNLAISRSR